MSRYLARLASRVQAAPVALRAPVAGLEVESVSTWDAPAATNPAGAASPPAAHVAVSGLPPSPAVQRAAPRASALERVEEQAAVASPAGAAAPSVAAAARAPGLANAGALPPSRAVEAEVVMPTHGAVRDLPAPAIALAPAAARAEASAPRANPLAPRLAGSESAALGPVARVPELAEPTAAPKSADLPQRATAPAPQPAATWPAAAPRGLAPERATAGAPQVDVHIGSVQLTVRTPAPPPPTPRAAPAPRAEAKPAFSVHRHYLRMG